MKVIDPKSTSTKDLHQYLLGAIAPRPIAFASTVDEHGNHNLAPYSFFNCFSSNPPILVFSSNRRVSDNTTKDTLHNIMQTREVVINVVNYNIVRQMALTSVDYPSEVSEFKKAGLTPVPSDLVKPMRVEESPAQMECKVKEIIPLGEEGGAGHLIICEVVRMHIQESVLDEDGKINPHKIDLMGRMGRAFYVRASGESIHKIFQPFNVPGIGFDALPEGIRNSRVLTGNNLGMLASLPEAPAQEAIDAVKQEPAVQEALTTDHPKRSLHLLAQKELAKEEKGRAASIAWLSEQL
ncbi:MAG: flavin reductase family protein [Phaeodactylibacter sp.]|uniref:flavin reductase family protein n=1 Tax=Phaeodactylibacter sp. TaxID=1940289 RepID=UPI0032EC3386